MATTDPNDLKPLAFTATKPAVIQRRNIFDEPLPDILINNGSVVSYRAHSYPPGAWCLKVSGGSVYIIGKAEVARVYGELASINSTIVQASLDKITKLEELIIGADTDIFPSPKLPELKTIKFTAVIENGPIYVVYPANKFNFEIGDRDYVRFELDVDGRRWIATNKRRGSQVIWDFKGIEWVHAELTKLREVSKSRLAEEKRLGKLALLQRRRFSYLADELD